MYTRMNLYAKRQLLFVHTNYSSTSIKIEKEMKQGNNKYAATSSRARTNLK